MKMYIPYKWSLLMKKNYLFLIISLLAYLVACVNVDTGEGPNRNNQIFSAEEFAVKTFEDFKRHKVKTRSSAIVNKIDISNDELLVYPNVIDNPPIPRAKSVTWFPFRSDYENVCLYNIKFDEHIELELSQRYSKFVVINYEDGSAEGEILSYFPTTDFLPEQREDFLKRYKLYPDDREFSGLCLVTGVEGTVKRGRIYLDGKIVADICGTDKYRGTKSSVEKGALNFVVVNNFSDIQPYLITAEDAGCVFCGQGWTSCMCGIDVFPTCPYCGTDRNNCACKCSGCSQPKEYCTCYKPDIDEGNPQPPIEGGDQGGGGGGNGSGGGSTIPGDAPFTVAAVKVAISNAVRNVIAADVGAKKEARCSHSVRAVIKELTGKEHLLVADQLIKNVLEKSDGDWKPVTMQEAKENVKKGHLIIASWHSSHDTSINNGHVSVLIPGVVTAGNKRWTTYHGSQEVPLSMDTGWNQRSESVGLDKTFGRDKIQNIKFYQYESK